MVYRRLKDQFAFEQRGLIDVKGKGPTLTYLLTGFIEKGPARETVGAVVNTPTS